jgi:dienelactone hydrolase
LLLGAIAVAGAGTAAACSWVGDPSSTGSSGAAAGDQPILSSTEASTLPAQKITDRYVPAAGTAPAQAFAVGRRDFDLARGDRALPTRVWYPAAGAVPEDPAPTDGATPATGKFPLVLFSHGYTGEPDDYADLLARWAQRGFIVAAPKFPKTSYGAKDQDQTDIVNQPADVVYVIDQMLALGTGDPLGAMLDGTRLAAAGHSAGGLTTTGLFSKDRDDRLLAGVVIAGTDFEGSAFRGPAAAMLFVHGKKDDTVAYQAGHTVFESVPWSRAMLSIPDGGHVIDGDDFEAITQTTTQFLRWSLYGDPAAKARIPVAAAVGGVATLDDQL